MAARNYERLHTRQCLQESLGAAGHHVTLVDVGKLEDSPDADAIREARAQIIEADSRAIYAARDISPDQAARIKASFSASIEDSWAAEKAFLKRDHARCLHVTGHQDLVEEALRRVSIAFSAHIWPTPPGTGVHRRPHLLSPSFLQRVDVLYAIVGAG